MESTHPISVAIYRMPNETNFYSLVSPHSLLKNSVDKKDNFYFSDFDTEIVYSFDQPILNKNSWPDFNPYLSEMPEELQHEEYLSKVEKITNEIQLGTYEKVVFSRIKLIDKPFSFSLKQTFETLCTLYPSAFIYCVTSPETGTWIGATPELLIQKKRNQYDTVALAGTRTQDVAWTSKEKVEQQMVTDYILSKIKPYASKISCSLPFDSIAGSVIHLKSEISFSLDHEEDRWKVINTLHPTPAVCGIPKQKAKDFIQTIEPHNRQLYTGFIGPMGINDHNHLFVNLRNMQIVENKLALYLGGGIMGDSIPEKEWIETNNKAKTLLAALS